jgi:DNA-binding NarL/FixJ family response regulator
MRIFIIDGDVVYRQGLKSVLGCFWDCEVVGEAATVDEALRTLDLLRPELFLVDCLVNRLLSDTEAASAINALKQRVPEAEIVVLTPGAVVQDLIDAFGAGALGFVLKSESVEALVNALRRVARGQRYITPVLQHIFARLRRARFPTSVMGVLSPREAHVFRLVMDGMVTAEIAARFGVSRKTIETHKHRILKKLGLGSTAALVRFAALQGLITTSAGAAAVDLAPEAVAVGAGATLATPEPEAPLPEVEADCGG